MVGFSCPHCHFHSDDAEMHCPQCHTAFDARDLEELSHLDYLVAKLVEWQRQDLLPPAAAPKLWQQVQEERQAVVARLGQARVEAPAPAVATPGEAIAPVSPAPPRHQEEPLVLPEDVPPTPEEAPPAPAAVPARVVSTTLARTRRARPSFSWSQVGTYLLSERTLNALLGLGAFLILAAGVVISTINPTGLSPALHLVATIFTTVLLYGSGYVVRQKLHLPIAGAGLLGVGAAFIPLVIWTVAHDTPLQWGESTVWLVASTICFPIYLGSHIMLRDRTFAVLSSIAAGSELLAVTHAFGLPLEWGSAGLVVLALGYLLLSVRITKTWDVLAWALFWSAQIAVPLMMLGLMAGKLFPQGWRFVMHAGPSPSFEYAVGAAWWLGALFYVVAARLYRERRYEYVAAWMVPLAYLFTLTKMPWSAAWYDLCLALLAIAYFAFERWTQPAPGREGRTLDLYIVFRPAYGVAIALTVAAAAWPFARAASLTTTLFALVFAYGLATLLLKERIWAYVAVYLLPVAYGLGLSQLPIKDDARALAWALLAAALLAFAEASVRRTGEFRRPLAETAIGLGAWRSRFGPPGFLAGYVVALYGLWLALAQWWSAPASMLVRGLDAWVIVALAVLVGVAALSAVTRRTSFFLYPASLLVVIPVTSTLWPVLHHLGLAPSPAGWARILAVLGVGYLVVAVLTDRAGGHYAKPIYLMGYGLSFLTMFLSSIDRAINVQVVALSILIYAWSAWLVHQDHHPSYLWLVQQIFRNGAPIGYRTARDLFLYLASWLFAIWLLLAMSLWHRALGPAAYGMALTVLAPLYVAAGYFVFRRIAGDYRLPWYIAGYGMSALGPFAAMADPNWWVIALAVSVGLYIASAVVSRRSGWLYLVAALTPVLVGQTLARMHVPFRWYGIAFIALGVVYGAIGVLLHQGDIRRTAQPIRQAIHPLALPFFLASYLIGAVGLALVINQSYGLIALGFALAALHYTASAAVFRQSIFSYAVAAALAVAYVAGMVVVPLPSRYDGLGLLPGILIYLAAAEVLRRRLDGDRRTSLPWDNLRVDSWSTPVYAAAYIGTVAVPLSSLKNWPVLAIGLWCVTAIYLLSAALFRRPAWLYPATLAGLAGYVASIHAMAPSMSLRDVLALLIVPTWLLVWLAYGIARLVKPADASRWSLSGHGEAWRAPWSQPLLCVGTLSLVISTVAGVYGPSTGLKIGVGYLVLLTAFVLIWKSEVVAWGSLGFVAVVVEEALRLLGTPLVDQPPIWAAGAFVAGLLSLTSRSASSRSVSVWNKPLYFASIGAGSLALVAAAGYDGVHAGNAALQSLAVTMAIDGLLLVAHGFNRRLRLLGYLGVAAVEGGFMLELIVFRVGQLQAFVLPAGLYLLGVAYLEWRRGSGERVKGPLETAGLILLLVTSLLQAVGLLGVGEVRYAYDTFLLCESVAVFGLGAILHWKKPFFAGAVALILDVCILLADPVRAMNTWYLVALVGFGMIGLVLFIEQRRQQIPLWVEQWRQQLEAWA